MSRKDSGQAGGRATPVSSQRTLLDLLTRLHLYIGLFIGPLILIAALTGVIYVLTPEIEDALYSEQLTTSNTGPTKPLAEQIRAALQFIHSDELPMAVRPAPTPGETTRVIFKDPAKDSNQGIFIDPANLEVKGDLDVYGTSGILPFRIAIDFFHRHLLLGHYGRIYSEVAASWMWVGALSGCILWFVRYRRARKVEPVRHKHNLIGLWIALGMLFFSATGLTWSNWAGERINMVRQQLNWVTPSVNRTLAEPVNDNQASVDMFDTALQVARENGIEANKLEINPAMNANQSWSVKEIDRAWPTQVDAVSIDPSTLSVIDAARFADYPMVAKLIRWGIDAHMGVLFGLPNRLLLAAFGCALIVLIIYGYRLWWRHRSQRKTLMIDSWLQLSWPTRARLLMVVALLSAFMPLLGISLIGFVMIDYFRWRYLARTA
ncbi:PepSY-associated TM helix domain-containing protein [Marinobacterium mangrovicola]|uniref:Putative iron-regulated membrane protein n=1 Tax=Marinobacterium mangrovicola TaxID=1476959 RepID=A0A4R1GFM7_9GAMM|nr:PepSY-associated TM helix domain-containing protein [Marinobacterium mangrovicola]TCK07217.1 putative iron-regulated membrane protein [Marinobacterium mangrovicola]